MQPKIQQITREVQERPRHHAARDDELQQEEGFNPVAGCLPMLLQIPIFISLYPRAAAPVELGSICTPSVPPIRS